MNEGLLPFGPGAWVFIALYLCSLLLVGWMGYRARREDSMKDFYLAGGGFGFLVLVLTLYATQYSGNTLFGFTGKTYRVGYAWTMSVHFMTAVIVFYLLLAPKLQARARIRGFITPADYLHDRFAYAPLSVLASVVMIVALANYLFAQLMAMGRAVEGLSASTDVDVYLWAVIALALIMVVYETLGGLRAVAWTDVLQGVVLMLGFVILTVMVFVYFGGPETSALKIIEKGEGEKLKPPGWAMLRQWFSFIFMIGIGAALYPQAIQRLYAARSPAVLRRSLQVMAFLPLTATLVAVFIGITALANFPEPGVPVFEGEEADRVLAVVFRSIQEQSVVGYWLVVVLFAAVLAALMSTADSALLSISSMFSGDLYRRARPEASEKSLTKIGKVSSWVLIVILVFLAIDLRDVDLVTVLTRKFDLLVQVAPAFFLGLHWKGLRARPVFAGLVAGLVIAMFLAFGETMGIHPALDGTLWGIHAGLYGLLANLVIAVGGSLLASRGQSSVADPG
ncbi:MAG: sodium:solute symporter family protein [Planctomycetota bacterium]|nr:sodium:solute symporter family protein [Planctomycetota bacterium]